MSSSRASSRQGRVGVFNYTRDAWVNNDTTKICCEISFARDFHRPQPLRTLPQISAEILEVEKEAESLLDELFMTGGVS